LTVLSGAQWESRARIESGGLVLKLRPDPNLNHLFNGEYHRQVARWCLETRKVSGPSFILLDLSLPNVMVSFTALIGMKGPRTR
jgi:hypothetical protein